jgi:hypothetical protein
VGLNDQSGILGRQVAPHIKILTAPDGNSSRRSGWELAGGIPGALDCGERLLERAWISIVARWGDEEIGSDFCAR